MVKVVHKNEIKRNMYLNALIMHNAHHIIIFIFGII